MKTLAIIGGGASGLMAAVSAAVYLRSKGPSVSENVEVVVYEADERVGRSILATGNGRCNFSNAYIDPARYRNAEFVADALQGLRTVCVDCCAEPVSHVPSASPALFPPSASSASPALHSPLASHASCEDPVLAFFSSLGLVWREEAEGRLYPFANKASAVLDVLRGAVDKLGIKQRCGVEIRRIETPRGIGARFTLRTVDGVFERADAVIVACGGAAEGLSLSIGAGLAGTCRTDSDSTRSYRAEPDSARAGQVGIGTARSYHAEIDLVPSSLVLGPLATNTDLAKQLDNIRVKALVSLVRNGTTVAVESGEVLFRKYGLSGIAVFNLSRFAEAGDTVRVDMLPFLRDEDIDEFAYTRFGKLSRLAGGSLACGEFLRGLMLPQVARVVLKSVRFDEDADCPKSAAPFIVRAFKNLEFNVKGIGDAKQCQVHRGGFSVNAFAADTMEALCCPGLFATGEALDVDAPCGGYNLHWAWASGMLAGRAAVERVTEASC